MKSPLLEKERGKIADEVKGDVLLPPVLQDRIMPSMSDW